MADDGWQTMSHAEIVSKLSELKAQSAYDLGDSWTDIHTDLSDAGDQHALARQKLATDGFWTGAGPAAALQTLTQRSKEFDDQDNGAPALAGKMSNALAQDGETLTSAQHVAQAYPVPPSDTDADSKQKLLQAIREEAQRLYTDPLQANRPQFTDDSGQSADSLQRSSNGGGAAPSTGGGAGDGQGSHNLSGIGQGGDTKAAFDQGAAGDQNGQSAGQGQGAGAGSPAGGSGGGSPSGSGGSGSGLGSGLGGLGSGLDRNKSGLGNTVAAGYHPSSGGGSGSGAGTLSGPRSPLGADHLPSGVRGGAGTNAAGIGGAGVRGGAMGAGAMGMGGAHGKGGKGEEDDEHEIPGFLINWDNGNALFGDLPPASPGVIGDWSEQEKAEKQRLEAEKRRYKSMGWDVKFD